MQSKIPCEKSPQKWEGKNNNQNQKSDGLQRQIGN